MDLAARPKTYCIDSFREELQGICGSFNVEPGPTGKDGLNGHLSVAHIGGLDLACVGQNADLVSRSRKDIRFDPGNHFFLILQQHGQAFLRQGDHEVRVEPGDMYVVDSTRESNFHYQSDYSSQVSVHLPRGEMCHRFGERIYGGLTVSREDPLGIAMRALLQKLFADGSSQSKIHVVEAFYSVFGALLTERAQGNGGVADPDRQIVQRALTLIAEHYNDPEFTTQNLAETTGVSLRRLQRAFQITGETPHDRLQRYRIEAARQAILNKSDTRGTSTITALAYDHGFGDLSTFYRLYRKQFGCAPGQAATGTASDA